MRRRALISLGLAGIILPGLAAHGGASTIRPTNRIVEKDSRVVRDRLHARNNPDHEDASFLNAVGAVWPYVVRKSAVGYDAATGHDAATGFLIEKCHVLTNMHVVYADSTVMDPPLGKTVAFAVGQTESDKDRGALQGLKFLLHGTVIAHGDTIILDQVVHDPANDWAVIRLSANVDDAIVPMTIAAVDLARLPAHFILSAAGFPTDHRQLRGDGLRLKDLWTSDGPLVAVISVGTTEGLIQTMIQTTPGNSGGPIYGDFNGRRHIVVGMVQGIRGNGIDVSESRPNVQVLFTPGTIAEITAAVAQTPCR